jgi:REP element-mobilizing transposase RayT
MDNHFHAIVTAPDLSAVLADLKKFTARRLLEQLAREGRGWLLDRLAIDRARHKTRSRHQVWQEGFHPQAIHDDAMMLQKLDYLHRNPVRRGWVASPEHWRYSSAHEWLPGAFPTPEAPNVPQCLLVGSWIFLGFSIVSLTPLLKKRCAFFP